MTKYYYCHDCGASFYDPDIGYEDTGVVSPDGYAEYVSVPVCPECHRGNIEIKNFCRLCDEEPAEDKSDFCKACKKEMLEDFVIPIINTWTKNGYDYEAVVDALYEVIVDEV